MMNKTLIAVLFLSIMGLLALQRFSGPESFEVRVDEINGQSFYTVDQNLQRGEIVKTDEEYLSLAIGSDTRVYLFTNTQLELHRVFQDEVVLRLKKGRMVLETNAETPIRVETNKTQELVHKGTASFVNFDFLQTIHVIPIKGSVQVTIKHANEYLLTPVPLAIHETDPVKYETLQADLRASDASDFYLWTGVLTRE